MRAISLIHSRPAQNTMVSLVTFSTVIFLSVVLAFWTWVFFAPGPAAVTQIEIQTDLNVESAFDLFGKLAPNQKVVTPTGIAIRLLGVVAATTGRRGYAVVQLEANDIVAVREGEQIAPGIRLAEVDTDHIMLERGGIRETLAWPESNAGTAPIKQ